MKNLLVRVLEIAVVVAFAAVIWSNVTMRRDNNALRRTLDQCRRMASSTVFHPGERFEYGGLVSPSGVVMTPGQAPRGQQLVLVVDPACGTCEDATRELRAQRSSLPVPPVIVSTGSESVTAEFAKKFDVTGLVFRTPDSLAPTVRTKYSKAPQIFLVSRGVVTTVCGSVAECASRSQAR